MTRLSKVESLTLANIYGAFFNSLFAEAKKQRIVSGPISSKTLTPPWMKGEVNFVHGPTRNKTIPFATGKLPRKDILRGAGKKPLLCAIFAAWIKKERPTALYLIDILSSRIIFIEAAEPEPMHDSLTANAQNSTPVTALE